MRPEKEPLARQFPSKSAHERRRAASQAEGELFLLDAAVASGPLTRHSLEDHVTVTVLSEGGQAEFRNQGSKVRLDQRPVPGRAEIESILSGSASVVDRQDQAATTVLDKHDTVGAEIRSLIREFRHPGR